MNIFKRWFLLINKLINLKKIGNFIKIYINNNKKYSKKNKNKILNFKFVIFYNYCNKLGIFNK